MAGMAGMECAWRRMLSLGKMDAQGKRERTTSALVSLT
jgi:hypothetical protein